MSVPLTLILAVAIPLYLLRAYRLSDQAVDGWGVTTDWSRRLRLAPWCGAICAGRARSGPGAARPGGAADGDRVRGPRPGGGARIRRRRRECAAGLRHHLRRLPRRCAARRALAAPAAARPAPDREPHAPRTRRLPPAPIRCRPARRRSGGCGGRRRRRISPVPGDVLDAEPVLPAHLRHRPARPRGRFGSPRALARAPAPTVQQPG